MEFIPEDIQKYVEEHSGRESELLAQLNRETHQKVLMPRMLSGHLQGRVLSMISHMMKPSRILEIGTYTGYSAICLAEGLTEGGQLVTLDKNEEIEEMVRDYFEKAGLTDKIDYRLGNAMDIIPDLEGPFDLVFIDADKKNYLNYFNLVLEKVRIGGFIIADNVLWSGKVVQTDKKIDTDTQAILDFNRSMEDDDRVENVLLPIRDGLMVVRRKQ
ncbi:MAG: class I SAM-dependent methyltransferase [Cytophagia bacterium]|nr:class I SAM-dependent methyltransferase [Cytophagia bacterium]